MDELRVEKETHWHFTCSKCSGWWYIDGPEYWIPEKLYCTHCGTLCYSNEKKDKKN